VQDNRIPRYGARRLFGALALSACTWGASVAAAQRVVSSIDAGATTIRQGEEQFTGPSLAPAVSVVSQYFAVSANGSAAQFSSSWSVQGTAGASLFTPSFSGVSGEGWALAGGSAQQEGESSGQGLAGGRAHLGRSRWGFFAGAGGGSASDGSSIYIVRMTEGGAWARSERFRASARVVPVKLGDSTSFTDWPVSLSTSFPRAEARLNGGFRSGDRPAAWGAESRGWANVQVVVPFTGSASLVAGAGSYPADPMQGFPGGTFATVGVRMSTARRNVTAARQVGAVAERARRAGVQDFRISRGASRQATFEVRVDHAAAVEVIGDFTNWTAVPMARGASGWWRLTLPVQPGRHEINLRVDRGGWLVPPGLRVVADEFGGTVGVFELR
jgi:hypothetical protein